MSNNAHDLSNRLLNALDNNYNVVDMHAVNEIISILEKVNITKELLETTRLGKHVNELRRKTTDPTLARRAKVLVKRWRDLVIPVVASPAHTGSNRSSAERQVRRLGGTPLTSPALSRHVVSPAVPSPRPPSRPAWGGYESDSQDVILVDDEPSAPPPVPAAALLHKPHTPPIKRQPSPEPLHDDKKARRDKKPKKRRGYSRAGAGTEAIGADGPPAPLTGANVPTPALPAAWGTRNGSAHSNSQQHERRRNGCRRDAVDPYAALVNRLPPAGAKKVKTTKELLEQIQSRGSKAASRPVSPTSPNSPASPDVMLIEPDSYPKAESPLRNGGGECAVRTGAEADAKTDALSLLEAPRSPLDEQLVRERAACTCIDEAEDSCPANDLRRTVPAHLLALHNALLPGVNGTRAPLYPHQFAVRKPEHPEWPGLFASVVPLYKYSDYADDYCVKNMARVPLCTHIPWSEFAPPPPSPPPPKSPPPPRPYPIEESERTEVKVEPEEREEQEMVDECPKVEPEMVCVPSLEPSERLKAPLLSIEDERQFDEAEGEPVTKMEVQEEFADEPQEHRTVERTKERLDGRTLYAMCENALHSVPYRYEQTDSAPLLSLSTDDLEGALMAGKGQGKEEREEEGKTEGEEGKNETLGRPTRSTRFAEWHECARLGELIALPYVVID